MLKSYGISNYIVFQMFSMFNKLCIGTAPCPLFQNEKIVRQPADLTEITSTLVQGAETFIKSAVGKFFQESVIYATEWFMQLV